MSSQHHHNAPNRNLVRRMARVGAPLHHICIKINISLKTLRHCYARELQEAPIDLHLEVLETLARMATSGKNTAATIFWIKTHNEMESSAEEHRGQLSPRGQRFRIVKPPCFVVEGPNGEREELRFS